MNLQIKPFSPLDGKAEWNLLQKIGPGENGFMNDGYEVKYEEFSSYLLKQICNANSIDLKPHLVPQSSYWLMKGEVPIGYGKIRHRLNSALLENGGHIGYCIEPLHRNKGYGKILLGLLLEKAKLKGIDNVLITCNSQNISSQKVITSNSGILSKRDEKNHWYWINI